MEKSVHNKRILVLGLAKSGLSVAKLLVEKGASIVVNDFKKREENEEAKELEALGVRVITGEHPTELLEEGFDCVVKNPGIPYSNVMVVAAMQKGIPVYTEIEIASYFLEGTVVGITGSNGKTTTTTLAYEMLHHAHPNRNVYAVGNIGIPLSSLVMQSERTDIYVTELSSFQLMGIETFHPTIACIPNIFSAHLDYHGSREEYIRAKLNITRNQTESDYLVYNADYPELIELIRPATKAQLIPFSRKNTLAYGSYADERYLYYNGEMVLSKKDIQVPGEQNVENILAAMTIAKLLGASNDSIRKAVLEFTGVKHRIQYVNRIQERTFYNDSKATNITATQTALRSFKNRSIVLIAGGLDRGNGFDELAADVTDVHTMVVYGETKEKLTDFAQSQHIDVAQTNTLHEAVYEAFERSRKGDIILFSPACASWDQYANFEVRGDDFIESVRQLKNQEEK